MGKTKINHWDNPNDDTPIIHVKFQVFLACTLDFLYQKWYEKSLTFFYILKDKLTAQYSFNEQDMTSVFKIKDFNFVKL